MALAVLKHKKIIFVYFGSFQTNFDTKDEALNHSKDPQNACFTWETPFQFQYQVLVPALLFLARDYALQSDS